MNRLCMTGLLTVSALLADKPMAFSSLPAAVRAAARQEANGAKIVAASSEVANGGTTYEVETLAGGRSRDLSFDKSGHLLAVEQEVDLNTIPAAARAAIQKKAAGAIIKKVESITQGQAVSYEAAIQAASGKTMEIAVNSDGSMRRD